VSAGLLAVAGLAAPSAHAAAAESGPSYATLVDSRPSLLAHWRLGEISGATASDTTGRYDGTYTGGPTLGLPGAIAGDTDTAVGFNGATSKVTVAPLGSAADFTIEGWTNLTYCGATNNTLYGNVGTVRLVVRCPPTSLAAAYASVWLNGTEYVLQPYVDGPSNANTWVHWVLTRQANALTLYRNGIQIGQRSDLPATAPATLSGAIGAQSNGSYPLYGRIDEVAVYGTALSDSDVAADYHAALPVSTPPTYTYKDLVLSDPSLRSYWRLGEASGATAADRKGATNGTYTGGVALGRPGALVGDGDTAAGFNGSTSKVSLPTLGTVGDFTIEGWTYLTTNSVTNNTLYGSIGTVRLVARPGAFFTPTAAYAGVWLNGIEYALQPAANTANPTESENWNTWVYWALTRNGNTLTLYRAGLQIGQRTDLPAGAPATLAGAIGVQSNANYPLTGRIDEVAIYTSALSAAAIANHYTAGVNGYVALAN
jgi:hypothetical protein